MTQIQDAHPTPVPVDTRAQFVSRLAEVGVAERVAAAQNLRLVWDLGDLAMKLAAEGRIYIDYGPDVLLNDPFLDQPQPFRILRERWIHFRQHLRRDQLEALIAYGLSRDLAGALIELDGMVLKQPYQPVEKPLVYALN